MLERIAYLGLLEDEAIALDEAALELAALDHPGVDLGRYLDRLAAMATSLARHGASATTERERAEAIAEVVIGENGFHGDNETYDDPANADLIAVMDRGRGLPVALAILFVALARRVGWTAEALNTPGHVLVRIGPEPAGVVVDPFHGGGMVDASGFTALLSRVLGSAVVPEPNHVAPLTNRSVLVRLLLNQATRARNDGNVRRSLTLHERMTTVSPAFTGLWWERARLEQQLGDIAAARASLSSLLEMTRDPVLRAHVGAALDALARSPH